LDSSKLFFIAAAWVSACVWVCLLVCCAGCRKLLFIPEEKARNRVNAAGNRIKSLKRRAIIPLLVLKLSHVYTTNIRNFKATR